MVLLAVVVVTEDDDDDLTSIIIVVMIIVVVVVVVLSFPRSQVRICCGYVKLIGTDGDGGTFTVRFCQQQQQHDVLVPRDFVNRLFPPTLFAHRVTKV